MPTLKRIHLAEVDSTNNFLRSIAETNILCTADYQTAGRGQGTNRWESEEGKNLTFSLKVSPANLAAKDYFLVSMAGALALKDALRHCLPDVTLKWPNDIYWKDRKLSGTLIETSISGKLLQHCILGIGLNVNQRKFFSDAPNPVSIVQATGCETNREELLAAFVDSFDRYFRWIEEGRGEELAKAYNDSLYRKDGTHKYEDENGQFEGRIERVLHNGHILIIDTAGHKREYEFKELKFII